MELNHSDNYQTVSLRNVQGSEREMRLLSSTSHSALAPITHHSHDEASRQSWGCSSNRQWHSPPRRHTHTLTHKQEQTSKQFADLHRDSVRRKQRRRLWSFVLSFVTPAYKVFWCKIILLLRHWAACLDYISHQCYLIQMKFFSVEPLPAKVSRMFGGKQWMKGGFIVTACFHF